MGDGFSWESNGDCNNNNSNNKLIRLVPALNESGRGNNGLFGDSLLWKATSMRVAEETMVFLGILSCGRQLEKWLFHGRGFFMAESEEVSGLLIFRFSTNKKTRKQIMRTIFLPL